MDMNNESSSESRTPLNQVAAHVGENAVNKLLNIARLLDAIRRGNVQRVRELLELGTPVNVINSSGDSPLHIAVAYGENTECMQELIKHGAFLGAKNYSGDTPLHLIIRFEEKVELVNELLKHGAPVNAADIYGHSPLHLCVRNVEGLKVLLKYGADVHACNIYGDSTLHQCVRTGGKVECVQILLSHGADASALNRLGQTPLHMISGSTNANLVELLLLHGVDIHVKDSVGRTPFGMAMRYAPILLAKLLVKFTLFHTSGGNLNDLFNLSEYSDLAGYRYRIIARYFEECVSELTEMRKMKIQGSLTLLAFVTTKNSNTALFHRERSIQDVAQKKRLFAKYPIYGDFIFPKVNCALERGVLLAKLKEVFVGDGIYHALASSFGESGILNYDCTTQVAKYLSNDDLCKFVSALGD